MKSLLKPMKKCFEGVFGSLRRLASCAGSAPALLRRVLIGCRCGAIQRRSPNTPLTHFFIGIFLLVLLGVYKYIASPIVSSLGYTCRFHPSCSEYAREAIFRFGCLCGLKMSAKRLLRCNPWNRGGVDPVPDFKRS